MNTQRKLGLFKNIGALLIVSYVIVMLLIMAVNYLSRMSSLKAMRKQIELAYETSELERVEDDANTVLSIMTDEYERFHNTLKAEVKERTNVLHTVITNLHKHFSDDMGDEALQESVIGALRETRLKNSNYFFIRSLDGISILNPSMPEYHGKHYSSVPDQRIRNKVEDEIELVKKQQEGFISYQWFKPGESQFENKISYVKEFAAFNWLVGTGRYESEIRDEAEERIFLQTDHILVGRNDDIYMLIIDSTGTICYSSDKSFQLGKPLKNYVSPTLQKKVIDSDNEAIDFKLLSDENQKAFVRKFSPWGFTVLAIMRYEDMNEQIALAQERTQAEMMNGILQLSLILVLIILLSTILLIKIRWRLMGDFEIFAEFFKEASQVGKEIETNRVKYEEFENLAQYANTMVREKEEAERKLLEMATIDQLTGCYNRRYFLERGEKECKRAERHNRPFSVVMVDIDHFKNVNDTYGHATGDDVLRSVSKAIRTSLRECDILGRIGGEEFAIILPETSIDEAISTMNRIKEVVGNIRVTTSSDESLSVTFSAGVVAYARQDVADLSQLIKDADSLLYKAKANGRNRICS